MRRALLAVLVGCIVGLAVATLGQPGQPGQPFGSTEAERQRAREYTRDGEHVGVNLKFVNRTPTPSAAEFCFIRCDTATDQLLASIDGGAFAPFGGVSGCTCPGTGLQSTAVGSAATASGSDSVAVGVASAAGATSIAIGHASGATGSDEVCIGQAATCAGTGSIGIGQAANVTAGCTCVGDVCAANNSGVGFGSGVTVLGLNSVAIGNSANASVAAPGGVAVGRLAACTADDTVAIGISSVASADFATALGASATASGVDSSALGNASTASADDAVAVGAGASASSEGCIAIGSGAACSAVNTMVVGSPSEPLVSVASGTANTDMGVAATPWRRTYTNAVRRGSADAGIEFAADGGLNPTDPLGGQDLGTPTDLWGTIYATELTLTGVTGTGKAVCVKSDGSLGVCSDAVGAGGTCTCS